MPAQFESGVFGQNTPAWHGQGVVVAGALSTEEALRLGGLDWKVEKRPLFTFNPEAAPGYQEVEGHSAIVRVSDGQALGVVGARYCPIQNRAAFEFVDFLLAEQAARWETAISINGGATVAGLLSLTESGIEIRKGDQHYRFLTIINTHDGSGSCKVFPTDVRVVCANTVAAALSGRDRGLTVSIRHSGDIQSKAQDAARVLAKASEHFARFDAWLEKLTQARSTDAEYRAVEAILMPEPEAEATDRSRSIHRNKVALLAEAYREEVKLLPQFAGGDATAYELFNAITRYVDHSVGERKEGERRFEYAMLGGGADLKAKGVEAINTVFGIEG